jgi:hypothetical protein
MNSVTLRLPAKMQAGRNLRRPNESGSGLHSFVDRDYE